MQRNTPVRLGVVGLGAMGREMLDVAAAHPEFEVVWAADPSAAAVERSRSAHPQIAFSTDPHAPATTLDALYIASPPATHARYAIDAFAAGLPVLCEKPLAIDLDEGAAMVAAAEAAGVAGALNFTLSDRRAAVKVAEALDADDVRSVEMRFTFPQWPRPFQRDAAWVAGRAQGGFLREVASHYLFLTDRLLGPLEVVHSHIAYAGTETHAEATLLAGDIPVHLSGRVAAAPETYEWTLYGGRRSYRISGWSRLETADADGWTPVPVDDGPHGDEHTRLTAFAAAIRGEPTTLADLATGLRVQRAVETLHTRAQESR